VPPVVGLDAAVGPGLAALLAPLPAAGDGVVELPATTRDDLAAFGIGPDALAGVEAALRRERGKGEPGEVAVVPVHDRLVVFAGIGAGSPRELRRAAGTAVRRLGGVASAAVTLARGEGPEASQRVQAVVEGLLLGVYSFKITGKPRPETLTSLRVVVDRPRRHTDALRAGVAVASATRLARDLALTPASIKTPAWLADRATKIAKDAALRVRIRDEKQLRSEGFGGIVAVGMGSTSPPRLIELEYRPDQPKPGHIVLVGKGITFDSGGLSLKQTANMLAMKTDMAAGGAVIATMSALRDLGVRVRVTGLVPAAENMPSGSAQRPSDVITQYGGTTVEVLNTDAEGRLVLADALAYADARLDPDVLVDLATLTGAISTALGRRHAGLFCDDDALSGALLSAADAAGEGLWRMPLVDAYRDALDSTVADLSNVAVPGVDYKGGAILAALFLREFAGRRRWAHLDIAGAARADADEYENTRGATGYGVRTLLHWLSAL
jgi:leucyl aminopeptidase